MKAFKASQRRVKIKIELMFSFRPGSTWEVLREVEHFKQYLKNIRRLLKNFRKNVKKENFL